MLCEITDSMRILYAGPLHSMVEHLPSDHPEDDKSSEVETAIKSTPITQASCLFMDSDGDAVEASYPHSQEVPSPISKHNTKNLKAYTEELVDLHRRLMALRERNILQQIVNLIEKTGHFNITKTTFDFDLFSLDEPTCECRTMAEASISVDFSVDQFICPVCLDLLKDPVTTPCGHSFCKVCINGHWDQEDRKGVFSCPQCRETFTPRPDLRRNNMLTEVVEKLKKTELQADSPAHCYTGPGDVECNFCTGRKHKAVKSCLVCQASYCEDHLKPHYQSPAFKKHKLVEACAELQEKICSEHDKLMEIYCHTDQSLICDLCTMEKHKGHETVSTKAERTEKQNELKEEQMKSQQRIQEKQKKVQELKQTVDIIKIRSQAAVDDSERIFTELISSMEKKRSEVKELIRTQEKAEVSRAERLLNQLEQEIADLKRRVTELEELSHTHDHIHFLQSFPSLCVSPGCEDSPSFTVNQHLSFDGVRKSLSDLKERVEQICEEEFNKIRPQATAVQMVLPSEPKSREDFLQYFCYLTLDPNTEHPILILSEKNRVVTRRMTHRRYSDHPERFDYCTQVLCKESVCGRCYWEVERRGDVFISVSYKQISRKGRSYECGFGLNSQSWSLQCSSSSVAFYHNKIKTKFRGPASSRIGVYVDHSAGTLSFYSVSDTMRLLHRVHTTFTQPLYAGFRIWSYKSSVRLCDP
ncbi:tripartite motif-containing protein 16-like isoform X1 [Hemibagrus wyckioides]|uniref:tripartite motif-containing protein 16-like isoform X1 n=2 Tax=Hemibagrus wyckioides TaxID=337641 RepID=UPI00266B7AAF|nr:tripartite motif-containing protein 16-like isoform X1 [Hemibagrus wyckioides]